MIGDSAADITAAKRAKIKSCLIKRDENVHSYNYENWDFQPDYVIDSLREILQF
jgi:phosphoglycolate phosphatase-like HAD superfamily hydrolase